MIAILLYLIGLISVLVTLVLAGIGAPALYQSAMDAQVSAATDWLASLEVVAAGLNWALVPFLGGLLLMGFARIMMLLGTISRALKGPA